ncbi:hypothetical protein RV03_GL002391 [Enterococcus gallinarum]|nr:hypothetical protein RV03_GL002391 [Enterococcus gallinarum]
MKKTPRQSSSAEGLSRCFLRGIAFIERQKTKTVFLFFIDPG